MHLDIAGYGGLQTTERGRALLRGEGEFQRRAEAARSGQSRGRGASTETGPALSAGDEALLTRLKRLRLRLAKERGVPAFAVFTDRSLIEMARKRPRSREDFAEIHGVGAAKLKTFADIFLAEIGTTA